MDESRRDWLEVVFNYYTNLDKNNKTFKIWQDGNRPKKMLHPKFIRQKISYIHNNPVEARIVRKPEDYLYSSACAYLGLDDSMLKVEVIDLGFEEGYVAL